MSPVPPARSSRVRPGRGSSRGDEVALPDPVDAERHQVVHQVVARRHAVEHRAHQGGFSAAGTWRKPKSAVGVGLVAHAREDIAWRRTMPELPEVETVMRGLRGAAGGPARSARAAVSRADLRWALPPRLAARLTGARVLGLPPARQIHPDAARGRRQRCCCISACPAASLIRPRGANAPAAARACRAGDRRRTGRSGFVDPRRFGSIDLVPTADEDAHRLLAGLGPEPLDAGFTPKRAGGGAGRAGARRSRRRCSTSAWWPGLGNIYVCEALFRARIAPAAAGRQRAGRARRPAGAGDQGHAAEAIAAGGSCLRDYVQPGGELGYFQHAWQVYGREGERCPRCPGPPACRGIAPHRAVRRAARSIARAPSAS